MSKLHTQGLLTVGSKIENMKKYITTIIFALGFGMGLNAQSDGFFTYNNVDDKRAEWGLEPALPYAHGLEGHQSSAPIGSGLILLAGMGLGYALRKKK